VRQINKPASVVGTQNRDRIIVHIDYIHQSEYSPVTISISKCRSVRIGQLHIITLKHIEILFSASRKFEGRLTIEYLIDQFKKCRFSHWVLLSVS
jgi:hypothetical protein